MFPPPQSLFVHVNKRCNLRCQHCDFWELDDRDKHNWMGGDASRTCMSGCNQLCYISPSVRRKTSTQASRSSFSRSDVSVQFPRSH